MFNIDQCTNIINYFLKMTLIMKTFFSQIVAQFRWSIRDRWGFLLDNEADSESILFVNSFATWWRASEDQLPMQLRMQRLNKAGDIAARSFKPSDDGFIVKTTWRFLITSLVKHFYNSSGEFNTKPSRWAPSLH